MWLQGAEPKLRVNFSCKTVMWRMGTTKVLAVGRKIPLFQAEKRSFVLLREEMKVWR